MSPVNPKEDSLPSPILWLAGGIIAVLMITGSYFDYAISQFLLDESSVLGRLGATFGWFPTALALCSAGTLLVRASGRVGARPATDVGPSPRPGPRPRDDVRPHAGPRPRDGFRPHSGPRPRPHQVEGAAGHEEAESGANGWAPPPTLEALLGLTLVAGSVVVLVAVAPHYWDVSLGAPALPTVFWVFSGVVSAGLTVWGTLWFAKDASSARMRKVALFLVLVVALQSVIIFCVKLLWLRPRMRLIVEDIGVHFEPWWAIGYPDVQMFLKEGVAKDGFKSFPSAHTGNAAVALAFTALATLRERSRQVACAMLVVAITWTVVVAVSRIIVGAHFLTDTTMGFTVTLVCVAAGYWAFFVRGRSPNTSSGPELQ